MSGRIRTLCACALAILAGGAAVAAAAEPARGRIAVADRGSGTVTVIDTRTDAAYSVPLPMGPGAPNPPEPMYVVYSPAHDRVFVGDRSNDRVVVFKATDFSVEDSVPAGRGVFHMWASSMVGQLWVNNDVDNTITVIDTITLEVVTTIPLPADLVAMGGKPHDVVLDPVAPFAYVTMLGFPGPADYVVKFSAETFTEVARAAVGKDPHVSLNRQNDLLYVPSQNSNAVYVLKRDTLDQVAVIPFPGAHGAGMTKNGKVLYSTSLPGGGAQGLFAIDTRANQVIAAADTPYPVPHNVAVTPNGKKIYVTHSGGLSTAVTVYLVNPASPVPQLLTTVTAGNNPFGLAFVP